MLGNEFGNDVRQAGNVATRTRQPFDETVADRITAARHHDGNRRSRFLCRMRGGRCRGDNQVDIQPHQLCRVHRRQIVSPFRKAPLDQQVLALDIAEFAHALQERTEQAGNERHRPTALGHEADAPDFLRPLREGIERRRECAGAKRDDQFTAIVQCRSRSK